MLEDYNNMQNKMIQKMKETIAAHKLLERNSHIVVGVSGGADSVALLRALLAIRDEYNLTISVCHVNHKIRPGSAERDQEFVKRLCEQFNIPFFVKEVEVVQIAEELGISEEEAGRRIRYDFFNEVARERGLIATAHNKNDNAETVMMRFMRGTGLKGLTGIPYKRDNIIRPLLDVSREEIELFLKEIDQDHITDESNLLPVYTRNKIRLHLIPEIQQEFNPNFIDTLANNIANYADDEDYMNKQAVNAINCDFVFGDNELTIYKGIALVEHVAIIKRAVRIAFQRVFNIDLSSQAVAKIVDLFQKPVGTKTTIVDEIIATAQYSNIIIRVGAPDKIMCELKIDPTDHNCSGSFDTGKMTINYSVVHEDNAINTARVFYMPRNLCYGNLTLRTRREGDVVAMAPGIRKKLKKFFIDNKIDAAKRDNFWLLVNDRNEIVWIPQLFGGRLKEEDRTGEMIKFEVHK